MRFYVDLCVIVCYNVYLVVKEFTFGKELKNMHILDISPTIVDVMGLDAPREWEGKSVLRKEN